MATDSGPFQELPISMPDPPSCSLAAALAALDLHLPESQLAELDRFRTLLWQWNEKLNLTRHTTFDAFASRDIVDSQQLAAAAPSR